MVYISQARAEPTGIPGEFPVGFLKTCLFAVFKTEFEYFSVEKLDPTCVWVLIIWNAINGWQVQ